jgi:hypothetical protein
LSALSKCFLSATSSFFPSSQRRLKSPAHNSFIMHNFCQSKNKIKLSPKSREKARARHRPTDSFVWRDSSSLFFCRGARTHLHPNYLASYF